MPKKRELTYIDLFAGCGGLSLGLHNAGWSGVFAIEKSKDAFQTLEHNLIKRLDHFDWPQWLPQEALDIKRVIKTYDQELIRLQGKVDMVTGGPPCQGFSTAGQRKEKDVRNKLIDYYIKFVELVKPKILFFENVRGFTIEFENNSKKGRRYSDYVINKLRDLGYDIDASLINFSDYGVPQKRCRFILVGVRKDVAKAKNVSANKFFKKLRQNREKFLVNKGLGVTVSLEEAISDLLKSHGVKQSEQYRNFKMGRYGHPITKYQKYIRQGVTAADPDSHRFANHSQRVATRFQLILDYSKRGKNLSEQLLQQYGVKKRNLVALKGSEPTPTITTLPDDLIHYKEPRILTVREYCRLQSFPDSYEIQGKYTTGGKRRKLEVPRYTQIGNAIPPLFGEQSGLVLKELL